MLNTICIHNSNRKQLNHTNSLNFTYPVNELILNDYAYSYLNMAQNSFF